MSSRLLQGVSRGPGGTVGAATDEELARIYNRFYNIPPYTPSPSAVNSSEGEAEQVARTELRAIIGPNKMAKYDKEGFFHFVSKSGTDFWLYQNGGLCTVLGGRHRSICCIPMYLPSAAPPTDKVICMYQWARHFGLDILEEGRGNLL